MVESAIADDYTRDLFVASWFAPGTAIYDIHLAKEGMPRPLEPVKNADNITMTV